MISDERLGEIKELRAENWFLDNPNDDVNEIVDELLAEVDSLRTQLAEANNKYLFCRTAAEVNARDRDTAESQLAASEASRLKLVEALKFYRNERNWLRKPEQPCSAIVADTGTRAVQALASQPATLEGGRNEIKKICCGAPR